jgi:nitrite reductase/ring-hydroxylating ferredoxin subunit
MSKNLHWFKIASSREELVFSDEGLVELSVDGKKVCMALHKDKLTACAAKCPHAGGVLAQGYIDSLGNIVCPLHRYRFSLENGRNTSGEGYFLKTYPVETREDGIYLGLPETGLLSWLK